jgi:flagellar basal body rod protein FlgG
LYGTKTAQHYSTFTPGDIQFTGNPLELAIDGDGFFVLDGPKGPLYTRNGQFMLNASGQLVTPGGLMLAGDGGGALSIPANAAKIIVSQDCTVSADNTPIGRIRLASFVDPGQLVRAGTTLFEAPPGVGAQASTASIRQGYREGSNVQVVHEMVQMIAGMRQYEAAAKALRSLSDATQQRINGQM